MLDLMRRGVKTWVAKILLGLLILSFAVWGIGDIFLGSAHSTVGAVGETEVDADRYARMIRRQQVQMTMQRRQAVSLADMRAAADVVDGILNTEMKLHIQYCEGFGITPAEMEAAPPDGVSGLRAAVWKSSLISHRAGSALSVIALEARHRESRWKRVIRHHAGSA